MGCTTSEPIDEDMLDYNGIRKVLEYKENWQKRYEEQIVSSLSLDGSARTRASTREAQKWGNHETSEDKSNFPTLLTGVLPTYKKQDSTLEFQEPNQTILLFDWDDTLCPTTWIHQHKGSGNDRHSLATLRRQYEEELKVLALRIVKILSEAQKLGKVVLVTNASRPWVDVSCEKLLREAKDILQGIPVIYAMEQVTRDEKEAWPKPLLQTEAKARAMKAAVSKFYSRYECQSWKNIVSIGDSPYEHEAIRQVASLRPFKMVASKKCRTKTIKMIEQPSLISMMHQLSIVSRWLSHITHADSDVRIDFGAGSATRNKWDWN